MNDTYGLALLVAAAAISLFVAASTMNHHLKPLRLARERDIQRLAQPAAPPAASAPRGIIVLQPQGR